MTTSTKKTLQDVAEILQRSVMADRSINIGGNVVQSIWRRPSTTASTGSTANRPASAKNCWKR